MLKDIFELMRQMLRITEDTQQNRQDIKDLKKELRDVAQKSEQEVRSLREETKDEVRQLRSQVERLAYEIRRVGDHESAEREKLILQLENQLLRFEKRLAPAPKDSDDGSPDKEKR